MAENQSGALERLMAVIEARRDAPEPDASPSYTASLLAGGVDAIGVKVTEEAAEVVAAAGAPGEPGRQHTIREAADVVYHLFVLLALRGIRLEELSAELDRRANRSGLEEKAARAEAPR